MHDPFISFVAWQQLEGEDFTHTTPGRTPLPISRPQKPRSKGSPVFWWLVVALIMLVILCSNQNNTTPTSMEDSIKGEMKQHSPIKTFRKMASHPSARLNQHRGKSKTVSDAAGSKRKTDSSTMIGSCRSGKLEYNKLECNELENSELDQDEWK